MKPSRHKMTVLSQIFKLIPRNLIPKTAKSFGIDQKKPGIQPNQPRSFTGFRTTDSCDRVE